MLYLDTFRIGWSEKHKSWKMQKARADSKSRHTTDFRTVFEIMIGRFVSCEIGQTYFTESRGRFGTMARPDFNLFVLNSKKARADSVICHRSDIRTVFGIMIGRFVYTFKWVSYEVADQIYFIK